MGRVTSTSVFLAAFIVHANAKDSVDEAADTTVGKLLDRVVEASPFDHDDLDGTTLGKSAQLSVAPRASATFAVAPRTSASLRPVVSPSSFIPRSSSALPPLHRQTISPALPYAGYRPQLRGQATSSHHMVVKAEATIDAKVVKALRDSTGAGMMACKKALKEFDGDVEKATEFLKKKGLAAADKRGAKETSEGIIETYIHTGAKLGVMVELNCETDFVAKNPEFKELARSVAMQIAATPDIEVVSEADISPAFMEKEKKILMEKDDMKGKPPDIVEKMIAGRIGKIIKEKTLLDQPFIKDPNMKVEDFIKSEASKFGENVKVARFARFKVGEGPAGPEPADDGS